MAVEYQFAPSLVEQRDEILKSIKDSFRSGYTEANKYKEKRYPFRFSMPIQFNSQADVIRYLQSFDLSGSEENVFSRFIDQMFSSNGEKSSPTATIEDRLRRGKFRTGTRWLTAKYSDALTVPDEESIKERDELYQKLNTAQDNPDESATLKDLRTYGLDAIYARPSLENTEIGGNTAINCYYQFGWDDDLVPPMLAANLKGDVNPIEGGLGRVYNEVYQTNQQVVEIICGVPQYGNLARFYMNIFSTKLSQMNNGEMSVMRDIGSLIGGLLTLSFEICIFPYRLLRSLSDAITNTKVTRFVDFSDRMFLYYRYCNSVLIELAINMGLIPRVFDNQLPTTNGNQSNSGYRDMFKNWLNETFGDGQKQKDQGSDGWYMDIKDTINNKGMYKIFRGQFSLWDILAVRDTRLNPDRLQEQANSAQARGDASIDVEPQDLSDEESFAGMAVKMATRVYKYSHNVYNWLTEDGGFFNSFAQRAKSSATGADKFVCFKLEKSTDSSESLSNSTQESPISSVINGASNTARMQGSLFKAVGGTIADGIKTIPGLGDAIAAAGSMFEGAASSIKSATDFVTGGLSVLTGEANVDIPEIWASSSFSKSYSFSMTLRSPYGDPYSVFINIYIPLVMLLCMALPRAQGTNSYTQPFMVQAYSKGMFAIPYGIIDNISIRRGASEFGWAKSRLPTVVEVSFNIKDMTPTMILSMNANPGVWESIKAVLGIGNLTGQNDSFKEYLLTLSASSLSERLLWTNKKNRQLTHLYHMFKSEIANANYWATWLGDSVPGRLLGMTFSHYNLP